jgi:hypothetical protein
VQTTFAIPATVNLLSDVEFGQGITQTVACQSNGITVTPISTFINSSGAGSHKLSSIRVSGIDSSPGKCAGKIFEIKVYSGSGQLDLFNWETESYDPDTETILWQETGSYDSVRIKNVSNEFRWISGGTDHDDVIDVVYDPEELNNTAFTLNLVSGSYQIRRNPLALANDVKKITIETSDAYEVGDYGPGRGIVFFVADTPFDCGQTLETTCTYLEAAPTTGTSAWTDQPISWATEVNNNLWTSVGGADGMAIGTGYKNSVAIEGQLGNVAATSAAVAAREYRGPHNLTDWFLPSWDELTQLRSKRATIGAVVDATYWSSSEWYPGIVWRRYFSDTGDNTGGEVKSNTFYVRPIRAF